MLKFNIKNTTIKYSIKNLILFIAIIYSTTILANISFIETPMNIQDTVMGSCADTLSTGSRNPAILGQKKKFTLSALFGGNTIGYMDLALSADRNIGYGALGLDFKTFFPIVGKEIINGIEQNNNISSVNIMLTGRYGFPLSRFFNIGLGGKLINLNIASMHYITGAMDVGILFSTHILNENTPDYIEKHNFFALGISLINFNFFQGIKTDTGKFSIPSEILIGVKINPIKYINILADYSMYIDYIKENPKSINIADLFKIKAGIRFNTPVGLSILLGYNYNNSVNSILTAIGLQKKIGSLIMDMELSYTYSVFLGSGINAGIIFYPELTYIQRHQKSIKYYPFIQNLLNTTLNKNIDQVPVRIAIGSIVSLDKAMPDQDIDLIRKLLVKELLKEKNTIINETTITHFIKPSNRETLPIFNDTRPDMIIQAEISLRDQGKYTGNIELSIYIIDPVIFATMKEINLKTKITSIDSALKKFKETLKNYISNLMEEFRIDSDSTDSEVFIDNYFCGYTPLVSKAIQGLHKIEIKQSGYEDTIQDLIIENGSLNEFKFSQKLLDIERTWEIDTLPVGMDIFIDKTDQYFSPVSIDTKAGIHKLQIKNNNNLIYEKQILIEKEKTETRLVFNYEDDFIEINNSFWENPITYPQKTSSIKTGIKNGQFYIEIDPDNTLTYTTILLSKFFMAMPFFIEVKYKVHIDKKGKFCIGIMDKKGKLIEANFDGYDYYLDEAQNKNTGETALTAFGNEKSIFHKMRLLYNNKKLEFYIDKEKIGAKSLSLQDSMQIFIAFSIESQEKKKSFLYIDNLKIEMQSKKIE